MTIFCHGSANTRLRFYLNARGLNRRENAGSAGIGQSYRTSTVGLSSLCFPKQAGSTPLQIGWWNEYHWSLHSHPISAPAGHRVKSFDIRAHHLRDLPIPHMRFPPPTWVSFSSQSLCLERRLRSLPRLFGELPGACKKSIRTRIIVPNDWDRNGMPYYSMFWIHVKCI